MRKAIQREYVSLLIFCSPSLLYFSYIYKYCTWDSRGKNPSLVLLASLYGSAIWEFVQSVLELVDSDCHQNLLIGECSRNLLPTMQKCSFSSVFTWSPITFTEYPSFSILGLGELSYYIHLVTSFLLFSSNWTEINVSSMSYLSSVSFNLLYL